MPTFTKLKSGSWRVQVRRKNEYVANTFIRRRDAEEWAIDVERSIDRGTPIRRSRSHEQPRIFFDLIALHLDDLAQVGKPVRRSKFMVLKALKTSLGRVNIKDITREKLIDFGKKRAAQGAGPATLAIDFSFIRAVLLHAAAVHGITVSVENVQLARAALKHLDLVGKSNERDRRPTQDELNRLIEYTESNPLQFIPLGRIIRFAVATAMRQAEICRIEWSDVDMTKRTVTIRDRKDPRRKDGNHQIVPLLNSTGYDAWQLVLEQRVVTRGIGRVFPHHSKSIGATFRRSCKNIDLDDLCFHDLRHEGTSRLFEAGYSIQQVAMVTGHKDWRMLRRYTNLKPEDLHKVQEGRATVRGAIHGNARRALECILINPEHDASATESRQRPKSRYVRYGLCRAVVVAHPSRPFLAKSALCNPRLFGSSEAERRGCTAPWAHQRPQQPELGPHLISMSRGPTSHPYSSGMKFASNRSICAAFIVFLLRLARPSLRAAGLCERASRPLIGCAVLLEIAQLAHVVAFALDRLPDLVAYPNDPLLTLAPFALSANSRHRKSLSHDEQIAPDVQIYLDHVVSKNA